MAEETERADMTAAELFREHGAFVARFLFRLGVPADAIDDAVQEVFLVVHQRGGYRRGPAKPTSYLAVIAANAASAQRRKTRAQATRLDAALPDELSAHVGNPERSLETRDSMRRLQRALDKLPPELRATLLLADGEDETCASIAEAMSIPVGTVYWRLHEARKRFQSALKSVDAALSRPRVGHAAQATGTTPAPALARSSRMFTMAIGLIAPTWKGSEAQKLLHETVKQMPIEFDLQAGLERHAEAVGQMSAGAAGQASLAPQASSGVLGSSAGALKVALLIVAGGAALVAALQLWPNRNATAASTDTAGREPAPEAPSVAVPVPVVMPFERAPDPEGAEPEAHATAQEPDIARRRPKADDQHSDHLSVSALNAARGGRPSRPPSRMTPSARDTQAASAAPEQDQEAARENPVDQPRAPAPPPPSSALDVQEVLEAQALGRADKLLRTDPAQALAIVRKVALHGRSDYLTEERRYIEVMALYALQESSAKQAAEVFLKAYPQSIFSDRVRRAGTR